jgi:hypothetical protein
MHAELAVMFFCSSKQQCSCIMGGKITATITKQRETTEEHMAKLRTTIAASHSHFCSSISVS